MYLSTTTFICALNLVNMSESPSITFQLLRAYLFLKMLCIKCCVCLTDEYTDPFTAWYGKKSFVLYFNSTLLLNHNENVCISDQNWKLIFLVCGEKRTHYSVTTHIKKSYIVLSVKGKLNCVLHFRMHFIIILEVIK